MNDILEQLDSWSARGERIALATVLDVQRSAPRPPGAKMAVDGSGEETPLSILAEVVAARHGRDRGRLADARGRIHQVPA